jgi:hypothetical protein
MTSISTIRLSPTTKPKSAKRPFIDRYDHARRVIDQDRMQVGREPEGVEQQRLAGSRLRTAMQIRWAQRAEVLTQDDIGIEHGDETFEVAAACRAEERIHHVALPGEIGLGRRTLSTTDPPSRAALPTAGPPPVTGPPRQPCPRTAGRTCREGRTPVARPA